ncbi:hypothetical protein AB4Z52_13575 [Rhizobium sp. 2YAF20]|uniref:hypothetical protein n=1 Tax=Rhizobium sp. 2YAF20 TaxID=3233027 RepID=UPI003F95B3B3
MGERQTTLVVWTWVITTLGFFGLIGYRLWEQGPEWLWRSSESLAALGIVSLSSYVAGMFHQTDESREKDTARREQVHQEAMEAIRALLAEQKMQLREVESALYDLTRKVRS